MDNHKKQEVVFLDTNALHCVDLYIRHAKTHHCFPFVRLSDCTWCKNAVGSSEVAESYELGREILVWSHRKELEIRYSPVSFLELVFGRAKGRALQKFAAEGVPAQMYTRFRDRDVDDRIDTDDMSDIHRELDDLGNLENDHLDISIIRAYEQREVWLLALSVSKIVFLSTADCLVYAAALIAQAQYLVTSDGYLRKISEELKQEAPDSRGTALRKYFSGIMGQGQDIERIVLPKPLNPKKLPNR